MENTRKRLLDVALVVTLISVGLLFYLAQQHYGLKYGNATGPSVCNVNATFNCDAVAASSYSAFLGLPIAVWGAVANLVLACLLVITRLGWTDSPEATGRYTLWLATLVALASVVMGAISLMLMHNYCLFCMGSYLTSFIALFCVWKAVGGFGPVTDDIKALFGENKWVLFMFLAVPAGAFLAHKSAMSNSGHDQIERIIQDRLLQWQVAPAQKFDHALGLTLQKGTVEPRLTIVEFADYLCPHCRHAYPTLKAFTEAHPDVRLVFKAFPLDGMCNAATGMNKGDGVRCQLTYITMCEQKLRGKGWDAHHYIFDNQDVMAGLRDVNAATERYCKDHPDVDCKALRECADSGEIRDMVLAMSKEGDTAQIMGTPSIFVNDKLLNSGQMMPVLEGVYRSLSK